MTFVEILQTALPLFVYFALFILLVVLIVLTIKLVSTINKLNVVVDDVNKKVKSLDGIFGLIDFCTALHRFLWQLYMLNTENVKLVRFY